MKKFFLLLLPVLVFVAVVFSIQSREYDFFEMLETFSSWQFDNGFAMLQDARDTFSSVADAFQSLDNSTSFWETLALIGSLIANVFIGIGQLIGVVAMYLVDLVSNITNVIDYLFI